MLPWFSEVLLLNYADKQPLIFIDITTINQVFSSRKYQPLDFIFQWLVNDP